MLIDYVKYLYVYCYTLSSYPQNETGLSVDMSTGNWILLVKIQEQMSKHNGLLNLFIQIYII